VLRPENAAHYGEDDLCMLAALYAAGIVKNHPFLDGNKRTGWIACELFLMANDIRVTANNAEGLAATMMLAAGELSEEQFADWLREMTEAI
ncbi:MAG: type II toxin-antitoxin system death-on-curing family toxin, partial [Hyphomonadaceae bacterium]|nr:type II toxin-antitoxin system death-on-curing family toxin [Hyphomonadaceae bacterium]